MTLPDPDAQTALERAFALLEEPSFATKVTRVLGMPVSKMLSLLPAYWSAGVSAATQTAVGKGMEFATRTMKDDPNAAASYLTHKLFSGLSGAVGGAFGLPALAIELPLSVVIMLRSIADIARSEGESVRDAATKVACIEVLALGGVGEASEPAENGYYAVRLGLAAAVSEATKFLAQKGIVSEGAPALIRLVSQVASRLSLQVSEKVAAQAIPILGAAGGATVNLIFVDHFQDLARGHFIVRRLERQFGSETVKAAYEALRPATPGAAALPAA
jgi:EcsC protein family